MLYKDEHMQVCTRATTACTALLTSPASARRRARAFRRPPRYSHCTHIHDTVQIIITVRIYKEKNDKWVFYQIYICDEFHPDPLAVLKISSNKHKFIYISKIIKRKDLVNY